MKKVKKLVQLFVINVILVKNQYKAVLNVPNVMLEKPVQVLMELVNHVIQVVIVMLLCILVNVSFVQQVGHLILVVLNVENAKLVDITAKMENLAQIVWKVGTVIVKWLLPNVKNVKLVKTRIQVVLNGKLILVVL